MTAETITQADDLPRLIGTLTDVRAGKVEPFVRGVSAINKIAIDGSMTVNLLGLSEDEQAEHKFHGGHLKALHQMPITTYDAINQEFNLNAPGSTGACRTGWEGILLEQLDNRTRPCNFVPHLMRQNPTHG